jgi:site-specific DNA-methyltransferase (adenine-specific)
MLIKATTNENDDCFILFGGSGSELVKCRELKRNFISCEIHTKYYKMILDRLKNNGKIKDEFRIQSILENRRNSMQTPSLFAF